MITDTHTHCFPDKLAPCAIGSLSQQLGGYKPYADGTLAGMQKLMYEAGVGRSVIASIATNAHQMKSVNNFAAECMQNNDDIIGFGSIFPDADDVMEELERIKLLGLKGVKLHPDFQQFFVDDEKMKDIYKKISSLDLVLLFHSGVDDGFKPPYHCTPERLLNALEWLETPAIAAHWGGNKMSCEVIERLCGTGIYFDTALGYNYLSKETAENIIKKHGADKILFGSDSPWHSPKMERDFINSLDISDTSKAKIFEENAEKLFGI